MLCFIVKSQFSKENLLLPRTFCYFDDLFLAGYELDDTNGEPLAISEFNTEFKDFKLGKSFDHINDFKFPLAKGQIYTLHDLNNKDDNKNASISNEVISLIFFVLKSNNVLCI